MDIEIFRLSSERADDYIRFFDNTPHSDGVQENRCNVSAGAATNIRIRTSPRQTNDGLSLLNISETASYRGIWPTQTAKQLVGATPTQRPIA